jgi:transposase
MLLANSHSPHPCIRGDLKKSAVLGHAEPFANNIYPDVVSE